MTKKSFDLIIKNANELITVEGASKYPKIKKQMEEVGTIKNGAVAIKNGRIVAIGETKNLLANTKSVKKIIDAKNKIVMPGFVDCHTHLLFGGSRENEFTEKLKGSSYLEILKKGGGILNTVTATRKELEKPEKITNKTLKTLDRMMSYGTTTAEVKTGYGLNAEAELQMLNVIKKLNAIHPIDLIPTFLGAHIIPKEYINKRKEYINLLLEMLPKIKKLAKYCDVFCEKNAFTAKEAKQILQEAKQLGIKSKLHTNQFNDIGGIKIGIDLKATSLDHLDYVNEEHIKKISTSGTIAVLLPGVPFHLMNKHYAPAQKMIKAGIPIALATDFNPGSCPTLSMQMIIDLACRNMKITPNQAINATTINASHAIGMAQEIGSIEIGKKADIIILDIPNHKQLPYWFGINLIKTVIKNGKIT